jgi:uncharacterized membrane protein YedE/YeeE
MTRARSSAAAFAAGALFAAGLAISGMTKPSKVRGFLDFGGAWDPTLLFVMGGAVAVYFILHRLVLKRPAPLFDSKFHLPTRKDLDVRLVLGAAIFGVGWGLGGYCPGPGLASLASGAIGPVVFVAAMVAGMWIQRSVDIAVSRRDRRSSAQTQIAIESVRRSS